mgnify:FL=1|tara:strand:- start:132 stop:1022 length:891 start_codon:yes stop_codon:yes gene_type:complete
MNYSEIIKNKINSHKLNWETKPFPHAVIDDFLPKEIFEKIVSALNNSEDFKDVKKRFSSNVELNKKVYGDNDLNEILKLPVNILGGVNFKKLFENYLDGQKMVSMCDWPEYGGAYPFHQMTNNGMLGSHVDHSHSQSGDLHVANSIYYVSPKWNSNWGGETILFSKAGLKIEKKIEPKPNRVILFIHSSSSFHGVNKITSPNGTKRSTYYMDYYINDKDLPHMKKTLGSKGCKKLNYSCHTTSFVPFFPLGLKSFKFESLFKKSSYPYLKVFFTYLLTRFLLSYELAKKIRKKNFN